MQALVYKGAGVCALEDRPRPTLQCATDAIVRISKTTICGTDLHILKGEVSSVAPGRVLGHEGVGVLVDCGENVASFKVGDPVIISCISSCGWCPNCKAGMPSHCSNGGGWVLGNLIDGTQAEYVRIPFADHSLHAIPLGMDEEALVMLSDILPTGFECGVLKGEVKPGDVIAIVGAGPVGLATLITARFYSPAAIIVIDVDESRLEYARSFGATHSINNRDGSAASQVMAMTGGRGVNVAIEAIGNAAAFDICQGIVAPGGHIANIGVHGRPVQLNLDKLWAHNITLTTRLVDTVTTPMLLKSVVSGRLDPAPLISHRFQFKELMRAYDTFGNAMAEHALKVIISNP